MTFPANPFNPASPFSDLARDLARDLVRGLARDLVRDLVGLVLPERCVVCAVGGEPLCRRCGAALSATPRLVRPVPVPPGLPATWTIASYEGAVRTAIVAHKERARTPLAEPLGQALAQALLKAAPVDGEAEAGDATPKVGGRESMVGEAESVVVVPVASGRRAVRRRGHDPTRRMAAVAVREARASGLRAVLADVLRQRRDVADQAGLTASGRVANLAGALEVVPGARLAGRRVVLVDDVVTTGTSLAEAARAVRRARAEVVAAATVAATPLRRGG